MTLFTSSNNVQVRENSSLVTSGSGTLIHSNSAVISIRRMFYLRAFSEQLLTIICTQHTNTQLAATD